MCSVGARINNFTHIRIFQTGGSSGAIRRGIVTHFYDSISTEATRRNPQTKIDSLGGKYEVIGLPIGQRGYTVTGGGGLLREIIETVFRKITCIVLQVLFVCRRSKTQFYFRLYTHPWARFYQLPLPRVLCRRSSSCRWYCLACHCNTRYH